MKQDMITLRQCVGDERGQNPEAADALDRVQIECQARDRRYGLLQNRVKRHMSTIESLLAKVLDPADGEREVFVKRLEKEIQRLSTSAHTPVTEELKADMMWDWDDCEQCVDEISDYVENYESEGVVIRLHQAVRIPDTFIETVLVDEGGYESMGYKAATRQDWDNQREANNKLKAIEGFQVQVCLECDRIRKMNGAFETPNDKTLVESAEQMARELKGATVHTVGDVDFEELNRVVESLKARI